MKVLLILLLLIAIAVLAWPEKFHIGEKDNDMVACTEEAKQCPDGSYVGRIGPNCEFAECPSPIIGTPTATPDDNSWRMFTDTSQNITYEYQPRLETTYIEAKEWPPQVAVTTGTFSCKQGQVTDKSNRPLTSRLRVISGRQYCIGTSTEGAAGSVYINYIYTSGGKNRIVHVTFTLRYPQCANFAEPQRGECEREQRDFNLDAIIDRIVTSIQTF